MSALVLQGCRRGEEEALEPEAEVVARAQAAAYAAAEEWSPAARVLEPLAARRDAGLAVLVDSANADLELVHRPDERAPGEQGFLERAVEKAERALRIAPDDPRVQWLLYRIASTEMRSRDALEHVRRAHELDPTCYPTELVLAKELEQEGALDEAEEHYRALAARGFEEGGSWYVSVAYRLFSLLVRTERAEEAEHWHREYRELVERKVEAPTSVQMERGRLGIVEPPEAGALPGARGEGDVRPIRMRPGPTAAVGAFHGVAPVTLRVPLAEEWSEARRLERRFGAGSMKAMALRYDPEPPALLLWGEEGLRLARFDPEEGFALEDVLARPVAAAAAADLDDDGDADLVLGLDSEIAVLWNEPTNDGEWREETLAEVGGGAREIRPVDFDHDGDVDLLAVGPFGARLLRNDGAGREGGGFADVTLEAGLPRDREAWWAAVLDFDGDDDVDLLFGGAGEAFLASNERGGRFSDASELLPDELGRVASVLAADLDRDGVPDLLALGEEAVLFAGRRAGHGFRRESSLAGPGFGFPPGAASVADLVLGMRPAAWWPGAEETDRPPVPPGSAAGPVPFPGEAPDLERTGFATCDLDLDGAPDAVRVAAGELAAMVNLAKGPALRLLLQGRKDNARGVGAKVEVRVGPHYRRIHADGEPVLVPLAGRERADVVRVTWPNGVEHHLVDLPAGDWILEQPEGLVGSCPFLYAWDGETYTLVSDVLGITPLGLPMVPGELVPPDHDEHVLVRGDQLAPRDGFYELQITEELREVAYLDRVRLDVVDHPAGTEVFPNERFSFPPFPEPRTYVVRDPLSPLRAADGEGRDWTAELAAPDGELAFPFEPYRGVRSGQFLGLAPRHALEVEFDAERVPAEGELALLLTGWFYWTDASVNVAAARTPGIEFLPPLLSVPDGEGGWRDTGPPIGFPAGKLKTMVVDVSDLLVREDPRIRLVSTLRLYWDAIRLATRLDEPHATTPIEAVEARLWERGFSEPVTLHGEHELEWFEWERLAERPRWNQHPGMYTRYGDVLPLLGEIDDRFVIMGAGDALFLRFPADAAPPLREGWVRDYLVFLDGWAKDRDPNTLEALHVEPLPFHGMSGYPYGPDEAYPDGPEHRRYRAEWNTRPAKRWIEPLSR